MVVSKCVYLTILKLLFDDYGRLCTLVCVVPRNLLGKCVCMCYMWSLILVLSPKNKINTIKMHFLYMSVGLVVFIYLSVCKQSHYFVCKWMISHLILWLMLGDVLCGTQAYNMWVGLYIDC